MDAAQGPATAREYRDVAHRLAGRRDGVTTRGELLSLGVTSEAIVANIAAERWRALGRHCIVTHTGPVTDTARCWAAVLEAGPRAYIDADSSLILGGLKKYDAPVLRVSVPRGARIRHRGTAVDIRQTRRWNPDDVVADPIPRSRNSVAAVRACLWARSDRQAQLVVTMAVQQGIATVGEIAEVAVAVRRDRRRSLLGSLLLDLAGGIGSLGELDVLRGCRERGLPLPDRQAIRRTTNGSFYLDFRWSRWAVVVEVDGIQHAWAQNLVADALRHNAIAMDGDVVLRLPVMGLRLCPDAFFGQIETALARAGWSGRGRAA